MAKNIEFILPIRFTRLTRICKFRRVDVLVHWSVLVICAVILLGTIRQPLVTILGLSAYIGLLLIHECGHVVVAQRRGCQVFAVELYPIWAITRFQTPWSRLDHCVIAWGGVLAQTVIAVPLIVWVALFGYTRFEAINAVLAILGFFSVGMILFNLLPFAPLDGSIAWGLFPALFKSAHSRSLSRNNRNAWR